MANLLDLGRRYDHAMRRVVGIVRPPSSIAWELRAAWAVGRRVACSLDRCDIPRIEGIVQSVSSTDAFVIVAGMHVPLDRVLAVHHPSRLGDSDGVGPWRGPRRVDAAGVPIG